MSVKFSGFPRFPSFGSSRFLSVIDIPPPAVVRPSGRLRGRAAIALATLSLAPAGFALAQLPVQRPVPLPTQLATEAVTQADAQLAIQLLAQAQVPARPGDAKAVDVAPANAPEAKPFVIPSPWDAPEPWRTDRFYFQFAYYTWHFHYDADHKQSYLFDAEYHFKETWLGGQWIAGMALFQNSFGQFSQYLFGGLLWRPIESEQPFYVKLTAGPLHGYSGQYQHKVPFNSSGVAPGIIPGIGYCVQKRYCGEFVLLGANAALFTIGVTVP